MSKEGQDKIYQMITNQICELLEQGTIPWHQAWVSGHPANLKTKRAYRGINVFMLTCKAAAEGFSSPWWLSFKQVQEFGGTIKKGSKSTTVIFWKPIEKTESNEDGEEEPVAEEARIYLRDSPDVPMLRISRPLDLIEDGEVEWSSVRMMFKDLRLTDEEFEQFGGAR
mgnify:CR=1 FL=1